MKPIPKEARTKNVSANEFCRWCGDCAYVVANLRVPKPIPLRPDSTPSGYYEEHAPCPYCEEGFREEFPEQEGNTRPTRVPWREGFWQQREGEGVNIEPMYPKGFTPLPVEENRARMEELMGKIKELPSMSKW